MTSCDKITIPLVILHMYCKVTVLSRQVTAFHLRIEKGKSTSIFNQNNRQQRALCLSFEAYIE